MRIGGPVRWALLPASLVLCVFALAASQLPVRLSAQSRAGVPGPNDWPMFLYDPQRQAWNEGETALSPATAPHLRLKWKAVISGDILAASPSVVGDTVYIGSWNGFEYALNTADGSVRWKTDLGVTASTEPNCIPGNAGVSSSAAVGNGRVYVGGGADYFYALDAATGQPVWRLFTGDAPPKDGSYNWASPLLDEDRVYSGVASFCDRPFVRGYMWSANAGTGADEQRAYAVPENVRGGGVWTSPTLDSAHKRVFLTTGSPGNVYGSVDSLVAVDLNTYHLTDTWRVPKENEGADPDWGTTPTLFTLPSGKQMVAAGHKNGRFYAFGADHLGSGPVWVSQVANGGECPQCGEGTISSAAYHDGVLYVAGGGTMSNGKEVGGAIRALDAATGAARWEYPTGGAILPGLAGANGVIVAAADYEVHIIEAATGRTLFRFDTDHKATIYGAPAIANGAIYIPSTDGVVYAYEVPPEFVPPTSPPPPPPPPPPAPRPARRAPPPRCRSLHHSERSRARCRHRRSRSTTR